MPFREPGCPAGPCDIGFVAEQICDKDHEPCTGPVSRDSVGAVTSTSIAAKANQPTYWRARRTRSMQELYGPARAPALTERNRAAEWALAGKAPRRREERAVSGSTQEPVIIDDVIGRTLESPPSP